MGIKAGQPADPTTDRRRWAVGVDTHTDTHSTALVDGLGDVLAQIEVTADPDGYTQLLAWVGEYLPTGQRMFWAVEGTRAHGHGLTRVLQAAGQQVIEAVPPVRGSRRRGGKSDRLDAIHAARTALVNDHPATPRADGPREALRLLVTTRQHYSTTRTATINVFKSVILGATELREQLRRLPTAAQVRPARVAWSRAAKRRCRADRLVASHPATRRSALRRSRRRRTATRQLRTPPTPPPQPWRRPNTQRRPPHDRHHQTTHETSRDQRLHRPPYRRRTHPEREPALPQALHRTPTLPTHADHRAYNYLTTDTHRPGASSYVDTGIPPWP